MAASYLEISEWFEYGLTIQATHMIIAVDTYDWEDYPCYVNSNESVNDKLKSCSENMQRVMEVYNLSLDKKKQLGENRSWNL